MATTDEIRAWQTLVGASPDGAPGPRTFEATVAYLNRTGAIRTRPASMPPVGGSAAEARARVVTWAELQVGEQDPRKYARICAPEFVNADPHSYAWCGIFWLAALHEAGLTTRTWKMGSGFAAGYLPRVPLPEPGDGMYFGTPLHHYAVVREIRDGRIYTVEGNTMPAPKEGVTLRERRVADVNAGGGCFFSIKPLLP